jgi:hypothetical protein
VQGVKEDAVQLGRWLGSQVARERTPSPAGSRQEERAGQAGGFAQCARRRCSGVYS